MNKPSATSDATANSLFGIRTALALLRQFQTTLSSFSERETHLERDHLTRSVKIRRALEQETGAVSEALSIKLQEIKTEKLAATSELERHYDLRRTHINKAQERARARRLQAIEDAESKQKFSIQREQLDATRQRDEAIQAERERFETFTHLLTEARDALAGLEDRAMTAFSGYPAFRRNLANSTVQAPAERELGEEQILEAYRSQLTDAEALLRRIRRSVSMTVFRYLPVWLLIVLLCVVHVTAVPAASAVGIEGVTWTAAGISLVVAVGLALALYFLSGQRAASNVAAFITKLEVARGLYDACGEVSTRHHEQNLESLEEQHRQAGERLNREWKASIKAGAEKRVEIEISLKEQLTRCLARNGEMRQQRLARVAQALEDELQRARRGAKKDRDAVESSQGGELAVVEAECTAEWSSLVDEWHERTQPLMNRIHACQTAAAELFRPWDKEWIGKWSPPETFAGAVQCARARLDLEKLAGALPKDSRLALPGPREWDLPICLTFPDEGSLVIETAEVGREQAVAALNNIVIRLLAASPPGRLQFTLLDPVELGQSFAGLMHLADYEDRLITNRIWTQTSQIEDQLGRLNEHIEKVAQMYLRNEYKSIADYNAQAGRIAEKYHFLVIADFPANVSELASRRLQSILASGPRCGVFTLLHHDTRRGMPAEVSVEDLYSQCARLRIGRNGVFLGGDPIDGVTVSLDSPPDADLVTPLLHRIGKTSIDSNHVEVPFADVVPASGQWWSCDTTNELRVPVGRTGATKLQYVTLGKGTQQHALVAGKTGSGKSTLFHVLITNLSLWCSPDQIEFYLVDFKKGVEFKCYATHALPHARVVAIESDREFGLSVLERVDEELKRRGELFRKLGAQNIAGYKAAGGTEVMPRTLLLIDEFQELFTEDDHVMQNASLLLDRIVRQGRAFGIHVLLGSQTLGGAYTLARATLGQMVVRIALQCNEADAYLIMDEENPAPRLLTRPGEAIYNDASGALEGNSPFQIVWLSDQERDHYLRRVSQLATDQQRSFPAPVVFEGNAPADVTENAPLRELLESDARRPEDSPRAFLGAPNSIKGPTEVVFHRQSGHHLLIVGQRNEAALAMLGVIFISLAAQYARGDVRFILLDANPPESPPRRFLEKIRQAIPHDIRLVQPQEVETVMTDLTAELESRAAANRGAEAPAVYLVAHELPKFKKLKYADDIAFSLDESAASGHPALQFDNLILDGASLGIHVVCTCDTYSNLTRLLSRKAIADFELRVLFQMSANDSAALIDLPKAGELGLHRAIFHNGAQGWMETFRPYALPEPDWIEAAARHLKRLLT